MTYAEAKELSLLHLLGDNSNAVVTPLHFKMAILDIETRCEPQTLITDVQTNAFRKLYDDMYLRYPTISANESDQMDIDEQLSLAVVFFICSYLSNKYKREHEQKAEKIISIFISNLV